MTDKEGTGTTSSFTTCKDVSSTYLYIYIYIYIIYACPRLNVDAMVTYYKLLDTFTLSNIHLAFSMQICAIVIYRHRHVSVTKIHCALYVYHIRTQPNTVSQITGPMLHFQRTPNKSRSLVTNFLVQRIINLIFIYLYILFCKT